MSANALAVDPARLKSGKHAGSNLLPNVGKLWFLVAVAGQWTFVFYISRFYGASALAGDPAIWNRKEHLKGYVPGDDAGNVAFAAHVLLAAVLTVAGTMQLMPWLRARLPVLHRWTGRLFLLTASIASVTGLYMAWVRGAHAGALPDFAISLDAVLILVFGAVTLGFARARDFDRHRRWAMRTFMAVNGVWFLRVAIVPSMIVNKLLGGPKQDLDGPIYAFWAFGCYLVPLAALELYQFARDRFGRTGQGWVAGAVLFGTAFMAVGIVMAWLFMWRPFLAKV